MSRKSRRRSSRERSQNNRQSQKSVSDGRRDGVRNSSAVRLFKTPFRMAAFAMRGVLHSKTLLTLPLMLLIASNITDYLVLLHANSAQSLLFFSAMPVPVEDSRRVNAESTKRTVQAVLYLITLLLCALNWRTVYGYLKRFPHLPVLIAFLLFTATYSAQPLKVITNSILILISILMPLLFVIGQRDIRNKLYVFYLVLLTPFLIMHVASMGLLLFYGSNPFELIMSPNRYGGFAGNPNGLGNSAALGIWGAAALILSPAVPSKFRVVGALAIPIFIFSIALSGSGTATVASVLVVVLMGWARILAAVKPRIRFTVNLFSAALFGCLILSVLIMVTPAEIFLAFTGSLGKDATLTGRTDLWGLAKDAIAERPWLGWSFDSHASVMMERKYYQERFHHYHNGFMDTMIDGGIVLIGLVGYHLGCFVVRFVKVFQQNDHVFALLVPLILMLVLNMSEYSLLRPLSEIWQLYIACFVVLTYTHKVHEPVRRTSPKSSRRRRSKPAMRWA